MSLWNRFALTNLAALTATMTAAVMSSSSANARLIRIIHTNDLHSHLDHSEDPALGGYAAVKATIDSLRIDSRFRGLETLVLDAGDFTEGSEYYLADKGAQAWRAMNAMGYDAVTLGNHDWLMGERALNNLVGRVAPTFPLLAANFIFGSSSRALTRHMHKWLELQRAGLRIAILGLTTDEFVFNWAMQDAGGFVHSIEDEARREVPMLRSRNDLVIALTHIGVKADKNLARRVDGIDLIVGGHSHTQLNEPIKDIKSPSGRVVPIVQTGMHGKYVGDLLIDFEPGQPVRVVDYRLVPVHADGPHDAHLEDMRVQAEQQIDKEYGNEWLNEVIGYADVPLENPAYLNHYTVWGNFVAESMRIAGNAEGAIDSFEFVGVPQPVGPITRKQLFILYPRMFDIESTYEGRRMGWTVWTFDVTGIAMKFILEKSISNGLGVSFSGLSYEVGRNAEGAREARNVLFNGIPIQNWRSYKLAAPEGLVRGAFGVSKLLKGLMRNARDTGIPVWKSTELHLHDVHNIKH